MTKLTELTRDQFNDFKKVKNMHSYLLGQYTLYGRKGIKYISKQLDHPFTSTRSSSLPYYVTQSKQKIYFFQQQGESLDTILEQKLVSNRLNSKHNNSELICWLTKYKSFEINLWEIFKLGVKVITNSPTQIILNCFRIVKGRLIYHYDSWLASTQTIVKANMQELQKFYFSENSLKNIRDNQISLINENQAIYRLAFLVLHLGTRDMNLRFYEYGLYQLSQQNLIKRIDVFKKRYPKLGQKIEHILTETVNPQQFSSLQQFSSINIDNTFGRNINSSVQSLRKSQERSSSKNNRISLVESSKKKKMKIKTQQCRILHLQCSVLNLLQKVKQISWGVLIDSGQLPLVQYLGLQQYYPVTTYQQKIIRLLGRIYLKIVYSKKQYSNGSVYLGQLVGDSRQGKGIYLFESGDVYYGDWRQNNMHGFGTYIFKNGDSYDGQLSCGLKQGHGRNQYASGNIYEGSWLCNHKRGLGVVYYKNGSMFIGEFFGNQKSAQGIYLGPDGNPIQGVNDQQNVSPSRTASKHFKQNVQQKAMTTSQQFFSDGQYSGELVDGLRWGYGTLKSQTIFYEGFWKNDLKHGEGRLIMNNQQIQGIWQDGFITEYR